MLYDLHAHRRKDLLFALGRDHHVGFPAANAAERLASLSMRFVLAGRVRFRVWKPSRIMVLVYNVAQAPIVFRFPRTSPATERCGQTL